MSQRSFDELENIAEKCVAMSEHVAAIEENIDTLNDAAVEIHNSYCYLQSIAEKLPELDFRDAKLAIENDVAEALNDVVSLLKYVKTNEM